MGGSSRAEDGRGFKKEWTEAQDLKKKEWVERKAKKVCELTVENSAVAVKKRREGEACKGGSNAVLSGREQVGPNLIHGAAQAGAGPEVEGGVQKSQQSHPNPSTLVPVLEAPSILAKLARVRGRAPNYRNNVQGPST